MNGATTLPRRAPAWRRLIPPFLRGGRLAALVEGVTLALFLGMAGLTYYLLSGSGQSYTLLTPPIVALLLVANLVPAIALLVLLGRRVAKRRAAASAIGSDGQLHVRLVAIFSIVASVPMLLVVIFASLLFQYGVQFWFSDSARGMLQNASDLARGYYEQNLREVRDETLTMAGDLRDYLSQSEVSSPRFAEGYIYQVVTRKLNRSAIIEVGKDGIARTAATVDPENRPVSEMLSPDVVRRLAAGEDIVVQARPNQVEAVTLLYPNSKIYLYATRNAGTSSFSNVERAQKVIADYDLFAAQSRALQLRFNVALFVGSLLLVGIAVYIALAVADWMVRPVNELVTAARRITAGDLSARVTSPLSRDEIGTLASAFNRMTQRLEAQTGALVAANSQLDEIEGKEGVLVDKEDRGQKQDQLASTQASYEFKVEDRQVQLSYQNLEVSAFSFEIVDLLARGVSGRVPTQTLFACLHELFGPRVEVCGFDAFTATQLVDGDLAPEALQDYMDLLCWGVFPAGG